MKFNGEENVEFVLHLISESQNYHNFDLTENPGKAKGFKFILLNFKLKQVSKV